MCKHGRLCDKPHGETVIEHASNDLQADLSDACIIVKCPKCSSKFTIYIKYMRGSFMLKISIAADEFFLVFIVIKCYNMCIPTKVVMI